VLESPPKEAVSLKSRVFRAGAWVMIGHFLGLIFRLAGSLVMTRLLAPDIFGIMAIATAIQVVTALLADIGLRQAVIQSPNGEYPWFLNTAWTVQIIRGFWICGTCCFFAVGLYVAQRHDWISPGSVYAAPILPAVIAISSFSAVLLGFQSMKAFCVNRNLDLKRITFVEFTAQIAGLFVSASLGWVTQSIWSFVSGMLTSAGLMTLLTHLCLSGPNNRLEWNRKALHELMQFGKWVFVSSALGVLATNGDRLLLGGWAGSTILGHYSIASNLVAAGEGVAGRLFGAVSLPTLSEIVRRDPDRMPAIYFRMRRAADVGFVGMAGFLFAAGGWIVGLLYDARYAPAGPMLSLLSCGLVFTRYTLAQNAFLALGRPNYLTTINIIRVASLFVLVPGLYSLFGIPGAIAGIAFHQAPTLPIVFWFAGRHGLNNFFYEVGVLAMWGVGWLIGSALVAVLSH